MTSEQAAAPQPRSTARSAQSPRIQKSAPPILRHSLRPPQQWLIWRSLGWPLTGDDAIFHFIAGQMKMGSVPYRDIVDINMPLTYDIHAAIVAIGGMSDVAWRMFDITAAAAMSGLILMLVWPAGRAVAILAALAMLITHLLIGPYAAGQRDFLMSIPAVALASARVAEEIPSTAGSIFC